MYNLFVDKTCNCKACVLCEDGDDEGGADCEDNETVQKPQPAVFDLTVGQILTRGRQGIAT